MESFLEWLGEGRHADDRMNEFMRMVKEANFQMMRTGQQHSVVLDGDEYRVVRTAFGTDQYPGKIMYSTRDPRDTDPLP